MPALVDVPSLVFAHKQDADARFLDAWKCCRDTISLRVFFVVSIPFTVLSLLIIVGFLCFLSALSITGTSNLPLPLCHAFSIELGADVALVRAVIPILSPLLA